MTAEEIAKLRVLLKALLTAPQPSKIVTEDHRTAAMLLLALTDRLLTVKR